MRVLSTDRVEVVISVGGKSVSRVLQKGEKHNSPGDHPSAGSSRPYDGTIGYADMGGVGGITVSPTSGQLKLKRPKNSKEAIAQLGQMESIFKQAEADMKAAASLPPNTEAKVKANLRRDHALTQFRRSLGYAQGVSDRHPDLRALIDTVRSIEMGSQKGETAATIKRLVARIEAIKKKWKIKPLDPSGGDPGLEGA